MVAPGAHFVILGLLLFDTYTVPFDDTKSPSGSLTLLFSLPLPLPPATVLASPLPGYSKVKSLSITAVPDKATSISASREARPDNVKTTFVLSLSGILAEASDIAAVGLLLLSNFRVTLPLGAVAFSIVATFKIISSKGSTSVSVKLRVEMVKVPVV